MYERFSRLHKLNNLIWVWNSPLAEWYPGDEVVDIISRDFYASHDGALKEEFEELKKISPEKIAALGECDCIPDPDKMQDEKALWAWFMIWCDPFILTEKYMTYDYLKKAYQHPLLVTLEDLPS
jgi:mannan endo-1,4-beta-mannosidase